MIRRGRASIRGAVLALVASALLASTAGASTGPVFVGSVSNATDLSGVTAVAVSGHYAYAVGYWSGQLDVIDLSNPAAPTIVGTSAANNSLIAATNITVVGNYAFITSKNRNLSTSNNDDGTGNSLSIVNISNPTSPQWVGSVSDPNLSARNILFGAYGIAVSGNYAYVASQGLLQGQPTQPATPSTSAGSFAVINIANPAGPTIVANIDNASLPAAFANGLQHATAVAISGHYAYVTAFYGKSLTVIDISNPAAPSVVASLHDPTNFGNPTDIAISGGYAYVTNQISGSPELTVVSLANATAPAVVGTLNDNALAGAYRLKVRGNFAYVSADAQNAVDAVDISNPAAPRTAGTVFGQTKTPFTTGVDVSLMGRYVIASSPRQLSESAAIFPPYPLQAGGPTDTGTITVIDPDPLPISITLSAGTLPPKTTSTNHVDFHFVLSDSVATLQCSLDGAPLGPCSTPTDAIYSGLPDAKHSFTVVATDAVGNTATASYTWTIGRTPANLTLPRVLGTARQGNKLRASVGTWSGIPTSYSYRWERCDSHGKHCQAITNQTQSTYTPSARDVGSTLQLGIKAINAIGSATAFSRVTSIVSWSSVSDATGNIRGSKGKPQLYLTAPQIGAGGFSLQKISISLPKGVSFARRPNAKRLWLLASGFISPHFKLSMSHGVLTLTLRKPRLWLKLRTYPGLITFSRTLQKRVKAKKTKSITLTVTLYYKGLKPWRGTVKVKLS